jgi:cytochrome c peroxidase
MMLTLYVTEQAQDYYKFKVPSLRNVEVSAPMHDGRFGTLRQCLTTIQFGVIDSPTLDPILKQNTKSGIALKPKNTANR